ncbi:MAG: class I SAM-dependent methyltransferase [Deltaproteobacteria bacterium]|nr:class I SAM-dependent methyltransferase [Deltaproteobacteria bacterium]
MKLDLGCGASKHPGYLGVDIAELPGVDIVADLFSFPWPFESESVEEILASHFVEHVPDLIKFMNEAYRITKPGGQVKIIVPYYTSIRCWQDPTHVRAISQDSFLYFNKKWREANKLTHYPITADFDFEITYLLEKSWREKAKDPESRAEIEYAIKHYWNVVDDMLAVLTRR